MLLKLGETNDAVKDLTRAAALLDASEVHYHLGEALLKQGHVEKAARHLARAVALGGDGAKSAKAALEKLRGQVDVDKLLDEARKASAASAAAQQQAARLQVLQHAVSQPLPTFAATTLKGRPLDTRELGQGHVAVVWFWATWCRPCLAELPHMESLYAHYQGEGVRFLGVSVDGDLSAVRHFLDKRGTTVPMGHLASDAGAEALHLDAIPTVLVIGPQGRVRYRHTGYDPAMERILGREIDALRDLPAARADGAPSPGR